MKKARTILITAIAASVLALCGAAWAELPSPVAHWEFDEGAGSVAYDSAGDNDGAISGAQWVDGVIGGALNFDGSNDYVEAASSEELKLNLAGSVSVWVKPGNLYRHSIVSKRGGSQLGNWYENYWLTLGTYNQCSFIIADGSNWASATIPEEDLAVDTWQHVAGTWDPCEVKIYLDGRLIDAQPNNTVSDLVRSDAWPLRIGYHHVDGWFFDGLIDDVRIYNRALSALEIEELYGQEPNDGLVAHWKFDEGKGVVAYDSSGDNDGTIYGAEWVDGVLSGALNFDGVDDYVQVQDDPSLDGMEELTVCAWFKAEQLGRFQRIVSKWGNTSQRSYVLSVNDLNKLVLGADSRLNLIQCVGATTLDEDRWYHGAGVYDRNGCRVFIDGRLDATAYEPGRLAIYAGSLNLRIGAEPDGSYPFGGPIDDVRIYARALSAGEVLGLYEDATEVPEAEVYHVDGAGGSDLNNGLSRTTAFATIQKGIDSSVDGGEVLVWPGVYSQAINFLGKAITVRSAGDAATIEAPGQDAVTFHSGEGADSVIKNLVIRNSGLGISANYGSSPTITNLTIVDNDFGIAAYEDSNPDISNCILWDNRDGDLWGCQARYSFVEQEIETGPVDGLIAHWKFDEGRGTTAGDSAGDNDGSINGAQWVAGESGGALSFDGANDYVSIPASDVFDVNDGDVSISMWFKTSVYANQTLMKLRQYDDDPHLEVYNSMIYGNLGTRAMPGGAIVAYNAGRVDDGGWHHVAASLENGSTGGYKLYLDGTLVGMSTFSGELSNWNAIAIGNNADGGGYFNGSIDDVRVYNRAISSLEAYMLYEMSREGPVAHWEFDEGAGSIAYDSAGSNDGVVYGAQWTTGQLEGGLEFDGVGDYVEVEDSASLDITEQITVAAWIKKDAAGVRHNIVAKHMGNVPYSGFNLVSGTGDDIGLALTIGGSWKGCTVELADVTSWHHVAGTFDGSQIRMFVDGEPLGSTTASGGIGVNNHSLYIGRSEPDYGGYFMDGLIDDVRIYARALSAGEIELLYSGGLIGRDDTDTLRPLFADAGAGDYHLLSERGRYWPEHDVWVLDKVSSPCIDAGDPTIEPSGEPMPNGGAINMGAYGGTEYASMSEWPIFSDYDRNGRSDFGDFAIFCDEWLMELPWVGSGPVPPTDSTPSQPDPMTWPDDPNMWPAEIYIGPAWATGYGYIMTCTVAADPSGPVRYWFQCYEEPSINSGWIAANTWITPAFTMSGQNYGFRVKARDAYGNETAWSEVKRPSDASL